MRKDTTKKKQKQEDRSLHGKQINTKRKRLDICLKAFSKFCADKKDVLLVMKCFRSQIDILKKDYFDIDNLY